MWFVYILKCSNGTFYVGCTSNLDGRLNGDNSGGVLATKM
jgi:predicted GIY-YIG superfamily endonuclease